MSADVRSPLPVSECQYPALGNREQRWVRQLLGSWLPSACGQWMPQKYSPSCCFHSLPPLSKMKILRSSTLTVSFTLSYFAFNYFFLFPCLSSWVIKMAEAVCSLLLLMHTVPLGRLELSLESSGKIELAPLPSALSQTGLHVLAQTAACGDMSERPVHSAACLCLSPTESAVPSLFLSLGLLWADTC